MKVCQGEVLNRALLQLDVRKGVIPLKHHFDLLAKCCIRRVRHHLCSGTASGDRLWAKTAERSNRTRLCIRGEQQCFGGQAARGEALLEQSKVFAGPSLQQVSKFTKQVA